MIVFTIIITSNSNNSLKAIEQPTIRMNISQKFSINELIEIENKDLKGQKYIDYEMFKKIIYKMKSLGQTFHNLDKKHLQKFKNTYLYTYNKSQQQEKINTLNIELSRRYMARNWDPVAAVWYWSDLPRGNGHIPHLRWHLQKGLWWYGNVEVRAYKWEVLPIFTDSYVKRWFHFTNRGYLIRGRKGWVHVHSGWMYNTGKYGFLTSESEYLPIHADGSGTRRRYWFNWNGILK